MEKEYSFLKRARQAIESKHGELEKLACTIVDLETSGLDPEHDEIIEIGALKVQNGEIKGVFNKLVSPIKPISQQIIDLTGITNEMLQGEPHIKPVIGEFLSFIDDTILIAHNAEFDITFLRNNIKRWLNKEMNNPVLCTLVISRDILPGLENHKLHTIARYYGIEAANRHRAIGDVEVTYKVWLKLIETMKKHNIISRQDLDKYIMLPASAAERPAGKPPF